ncbi:DeoR/GlpR family DNA-binding transcription regulator [Alkalibacterium iburiense]|uniref:DeoR/GlpR family DNA-binding transcription regulator n=1 Tax=Alkalibacterium iburiense TaxID=290589 RepID=A0ABP3GY65_9LACT
MIYLPQNRRDEIINVLKSKEYAEVSYLSHKFKVSEMTIRRDVEKLVNSGLVVKVYGGVRLKHNNITEYDTPVKDRKNINHTAKRLIALNAVDFIDDGDVIAFDASTTALEISNQMKFKKKVTVVTNNINIAIELADDPDIPIILLGGFMRKKSLSLTGSLISKSISSIYIDKAFISSKSINFNDGLTDVLMDEGEAKQAIINKSDKVFALCDHTKINTRSFFKICSHNKIDTLITDSLGSFDEEQKSCLDLYRENGTNVIIATE